MREFAADHDKKLAKWLPVVAFVSLVLWSLISRTFQIGHPPVGTYIGILAFVAAVVTLWPPDSGRGNALWLLVFGGFLMQEVTTLYQQKHDDEQQRATDQMEEDNRFANLRTQEDNRFAALLKTQNESFGQVLKQNQDEFRETIKGLGNLAGASGRIESTANESLRKFGDVIQKEQDLFQHEEELAEALRGKLVPGNEPTPANYCPAPQPGDLLLFFGNEEQHNAALVSRFPHVVLRSALRGPMVTLDRDGNMIAILLDIKSSDGKIIARLNSSGWVVNRNNVLSASRDTHTR